MWLENLMGVGPAKYAGMTRNQIIDYMNLESKKKLKEELMVCIKMEGKTFRTTADLSSDLIVFDYHRDVFARYLADKLSEKSKMNKLLKKERKTVYDLVDAYFLRQRNVS